MLIMSTGTGSMRLSLTSAGSSSQMDPPSTFLAGGRRHADLRDEVADLSTNGAHSNSNSLNL